MQSGIQFEFDVIPAPEPESILNLILIFGLAPLRNLA